MNQWQSAVDLFLTDVNGRRRGAKLLLLNLNEPGFRSFFNQHTDLHRRLFVALVLDQILLACPNPFILLYSGQPSEDPDFVDDEVFQSYAAIWLHEHGHPSFCSISSWSIPRSETSRLLDALSFAMASDDALLNELIHSVCPFVTLMGTTKSYSRIDALDSLLGSVRYHRGRTVSEIHRISSELDWALSAGNDLDGLWRSPTHPPQEKADGDQPRLETIDSQVNSHDCDMTSKANLMTQGMEEMVEYDIGDPDLERSLLIVTQAYFQKLTAHPAWLGSDLACVAFDGDPSFVPEMLERVSPHDEDYLVFRGLTDPESLILDVGANWGYSVSSIESSGAKSGIASFEAIPMYRPCLAAIAELRPNKYHYFMTALSDSAGELVFTVPVVNHQALTALTTAAAQPKLKKIVRDVVNHMRQWMPDLQRFQYRLVSFCAPVQRLDDVVSLHPEAFAKKDIVAIKIDVEGMEYPVLRGAENVISRHKPLIMAEVGTTNEQLVDYLETLGYEQADRSGSMLRLGSPSKASRSNSFFVHHDKRSQYQSSGILC